MAEGVLVTGCVMQQNRLRQFWSGRLAMGPMCSQQATWLYKQLVEVAVAAAHQVAYNTVHLKG